MKSIRTPALILALLYLCFLSCLAFSAPTLPASVAIHFDATGIPDAWTSSAQYLRSLSMFGFGFSLFVPAITWLLRLLPAKSINIPRREYWLAPERRSKFSAYIFRHSLWFASMALAFVIGIHFSVVHANNSDPVQLPTSLILGIAGCFVAGTAAWIVSMLRHLGNIEVTQADGSTAPSRHTV